MPQTPNLLQQVWGRQPFSADFYILGSADTNFTIHQRFETGQDMMRPVLEGDYFSEQYLDYGAVYASKSFLLEDGRRLWLGWVYEVGGRSPPWGVSARM